MMTHEPSDTYQNIWKDIIEPLLFQIYNRFINQYCIRVDRPHYEIWQKFEEYRSNTMDYMYGDRLDRHKLASCLCGAIIEVQPLVCINNQKLSHAIVNETLALYCGLNIIKYFMMKELLSEVSAQKRKDAIHYLKEHFDMEAPKLEENICDRHPYRENLAYALKRTHHQCNDRGRECYHYDVLAYSKIFYHLEVYNRDRLRNCYDEYKLTV